MEREKRILHTRYSVIIVALGVTLFLLMAGNTFWTQSAMSQVTLDEILNINDPEYKAINTNNSADDGDTGTFSDDTSTGDGTIISEPVDSGLHISDVLNMDHVTHCVKVRPGMFNCDSIIVTFFDQSEELLLSRYIVSEQAREMINKLLKVKDTCRTTRHSAETATGCNASSASDFICSGAPHIPFRVSNDLKNFIIFVPPAYGEAEGTNTPNIEVEQEPLPGVEVEQEPLLDIEVEQEPLPGVEVEQEPLPGAEERFISDIVFEPLPPLVEIENEKPATIIEPQPDLNIIEDTQLPSDRIEPQAPLREVPQITLPYIIETTPLSMPIECVEEGAETKLQCERIIEKNSLPESCRAMGIITKESCKRYTLEMAHAQQGSTGTSGGTALSVSDLPAKCVRLGISNPERCNYVMNQTLVAKECQQAGVSTRDVCEIHLREIKIKEACSSSVDEDDCKNTLIENFKETTACIGLTQSNCQDELINRHFGVWLAKREEIEKQQRITSALIDKPILSINRLEDEEREVMEQTFTNDRPVYIYPAVGSTVLTEEDELDSVPPAVILLDNDGDGLPNEMEKRIGTDPNRRDTDDDGFDDRTELQNGFDPFGDGEREIGFWPIDGVIAYQLPLEQPKLSEAQVDDSLRLNEVINEQIEDVANVNKITGRGPANTLITLFVYSTLPMVLTVQTDSDGNFEYSLEESLADGEHEAYIALVDNLGVITKKSAPLTFFVKEARAVETDEFFDFETMSVTTSSEPVSLLSRYYLYGAVALVMFAIAISIFFIWNRKSGVEELPDTGEDDAPHV